jgi:hypothetical protein
VVFLEVFGIPSIPLAFFNFKNSLISVSHMVLLFQGGGRYLQLRVELGLYPPPAIHGFHHTVYAVQSAIALTLFTD